jgi:thioredoxin 1
MEVVITQANFDQEVLKSEVPVLVDFWAPWCGPCRVIGPIVEEIAKEYEGKPVKIGKCNVDENNALAMKFGIMSIPSLLIFKGGAVADQMMGTQAKEKIVEKLEKAMAA